MRIPEPITIYGFGHTNDPLTEANPEAANNRVHTLTHQLAAERHADPADVFAEVLAAIAVTRYHNKAVPLLTEYQKISRAARAAVRAADEAYAELTQRTTTAWHAAHHRYIVAVTHARSLLAANLEAAAPLAKHDHDFDMRGLLASFYDRLVPAGRRIDMKEMRAELAALEAETAFFTEVQRGRMQMLSYTLTGAIPAGFEADLIPAPDYTSTSHEPRTSKS